MMSTVISFKIAELEQMRADVARDMWEASLPDYGSTQSVCNDDGWLSIKWKDVDEYMSCHLITESKWGVIKGWVWYG